MQTMTEAVARFRDEVDADLLALHDELVAAKKARWRRDPHWPGVYGLIRNGYVLAVVFDNGTWTIHDRFENLLARR